MDSFFENLYGDIAKLLFYEGVNAKTIANRKSIIFLTQQTTYRKQEEEEEKTLESKKNLHWISIVRFSFIHEYIFVILSKRFHSLRSVLVYFFKYKDWYGFSSISREKENIINVGCNRQYIYIYIFENRHKE